MIERKKSGINSSIFYKYYSLLNKSPTLCDFEIIVHPMRNGGCMKNIINFGLASVAAITLSQPAHSSALIEKDEASKTIRVIGRIIYSGTALTDEIAEASTREIQDMWSEIPTDIKLGGTSYRVEFDIDYVIQGRRELSNLDSCAYNFIQVLNKTNAGDRSYYTGLGSRNGVFYTSDGLGTSTTVAHEFGHGLMLDHNPDDQRSASVPGIMFARGTLVRSEYQWSPTAQAGASGGTINPKFRKVRTADIAAIPFADAIKNSNGRMSCLGLGRALKIK